MALARDERLRLLFASDGAGVERHRQFILSLGIGDYPYLLSESLGRRFEVSRLPFAALIAADGTLAGKGLVNTREHLESLVESMETGIHTLQDYLQQVLPETDNTRASLHKQRESA
jgi:methylamine dehydrogenase accessory protein MauD